MPQSAAGPEEVVLDQNTITHDLGIQCEYLMMGVMKVSPDQSLLAFTLDVTGDESYTLYFRDLTTRQVFESIPDVVTVVFASAMDPSVTQQSHVHHGRVVFYTQADKCVPSCVYHRVLCASLCVPLCVHTFMYHCASLRTPLCVAGRVPLQ